MTKSEPLPSLGTPTPPTPIDIDAAFTEFLALHKVQYQIVLPVLFVQGAQELAQRLGIAELALKEPPKIVFHPIGPAIEMSKE